MSLQIKLTLSDSMAKRLQQEKNKFSYNKIQEVIYEVLRDKFFKDSADAKGKTKRGRPSEIDYSKAFKMKRVFTTRGGQKVDM